ncbi:MAG: DUF3267 domain-containing protein [Prevotella sp.]|nr:DUF3267 domain-containing protein [Prevotella sp.]
MKLIFKGKFASYDELPKGELPENAVAFKEPKTLTGINLTALLFVLPAAILMFLLLTVRGRLEIFAAYNFHGLVISLLLSVPHELIHAVFMGRDAEVFMYCSPKHLMMFVTALSPMTKARFIAMSFMPALILGWIPFLAGLLFFPANSAAGGLLAAVGLYGALMGAGDYMNMFNAAVQMPRGSLTQMSGVNSYWFMPEKDTEMKG